MRQDGKAHRDLVFLDLENLYGVYLIILNTNRKLVHCQYMQTSKKVKTVREDDLTEEEIADMQQFDIDKAKAKTKVSTLEELLKELHK